MKFWNGNKSAARQRYEMEVLQLVMGELGLDQTAPAFVEDRTDYPRAEDEGNIFSSGVDVLVTVAGNPKFLGKPKHVIPHPIAKGLLGSRLLIIRKESASEFASIRSEAQMKSKVAGIPATWVDANIFRANGYPILENGSFEEIFNRLCCKEFDYVALGAFEIEEVFRTMAEPEGSLTIEKSLMLSYPMPLVFYVHPDQQDLAAQIEKGLIAIRESGRLDALFDQHFGAILKRLSLNTRRTHRLTNPMLPDGIFKRG